MMPTYTASEPTVFIVDADAGTRRAAADLVRPYGYRAEFCATLQELADAVEPAGHVLGCVVVGMKAIEKPGLIVPASLLFVAAVYTKQTSIAAPAALFAVLLLVRTRTALIGIATCIVTGLAALFALNAVTDGGFVRHVFLYNVNRIDLSRNRNLQHEVVVGIWEERTPKKIDSREFTR